LQLIKLENGIYQHDSFFRIPICALQIFDLCLVSFCISSGGKWRRLRCREEKDYLNRVESKAVKYTMEKFHERRHTFGTVAMIENAGKSPREVYVDYTGIPIPKQKR